MTPKKIRIFRREHLNLLANSALPNKCTQQLDTGRQNKLDQKWCNIHSTSGLRELEGAMEGQFAPNHVKSGIYVNTAAN
jgi:hypothetical protein